MHCHPRARAMAVDQARFGLKTWFRRRWCPVGFRPPWVFQDRYEWLWLYAAVEPKTGESFTMYMPHLDHYCFGVFLEQLRAHYANDEIVLVSDRSGAHTSKQVYWPEGIHSVLLPSGSPELDPVERWFKELRAALSNRIFDTLASMEEALTEAMRPYWEDPGKLARLTGYPWWMQAVSGIQTSLT